MTCKQTLIIIVFLRPWKIGFSEKRNGNFLMRTDHINATSSTQEKVLGSTTDNQLLYKSHLGNIYIFTMLYIYFRTESLHFLGSKLWASISYDFKLLTLLTLFKNIIKTSMAQNLPFLISDLFAQHLDFCELSQLKINILD